jgi:Leucine-rich repeat (LRR) protein
VRSVFACFLLFASSFVASRAEYFSLDNSTARVVLCTDPPGTSSVGTNYQVQVFTAPFDATPELFRPTDPPSTTFQGAPGTAGAGYILPTIFQATSESMPYSEVYVRIFDGTNWDTATMRCDKLIPLAEISFGSLGAPAKVSLGNSPLVACQPPPPSTGIPLTELDIPDPELRYAIVLALGRDLIHQITTGDMASLQELTAPLKHSVQIHTLQGLDLATNLTSLTLAGWVFYGGYQGSSIPYPTLILHDFSPLAALTKLQTLDLSFNPLSSLTVPASLTNLQTLKLIGDYLTNLTVSSAAALPNLRDLELGNYTELGNNRLTDLSFLRSFPGLRSLVLNNNSLSSSLLPETLTELIGLDLSLNKLSSLVLPATLTSLTALSAGYNQLTNVAIPATLVNLNIVGLSENPLQTVSLPAGITNLNLGSATNVSVTYWPEVRSVERSSAGQVSFRVFGVPGGSFAVLRSFDLRKWSVIGTVLMTSTNAVSGVPFTDTNTASQVAFYSLR